MRKKSSNENTRVLSVRGVENFRDLGGYTGFDGRTVKWGCLYRSGQLSNLNNRGLTTLSNLNLHTVIDFRSKLEVEKHPNRLPPGTRQINLPILGQLNKDMEQEVHSRIKNNNFLDFKPEDFFLAAYQEFATGFTPKYKSFVHTVLNAKGSPVLWHCTAGKDRTGFASAILLQLLGVDLDIIYQDYLLSNQYMKRMNKILMLAVLARGMKAYRMIQPLRQVQRKWLERAILSIDNEWGDFQSYAREGLALDQADIRKLQDTLLE